MTREEAIKLLEYLATDTTGALADYSGAYAKFLIRVIDALDMAISTLREQEERSKGCDFCNTFDFKTVAPEIDKYGARLLLAISGCVFPNNRQFKVCPVCGRRLEEV